MKLSSELIVKKLYIRMSLGAGKQFRTATPLTIEPSHWNSKIQAPIKYQNDPEKLIIYQSLQGLHKLTRLRFVKDSVDGIPIDKYWLKALVNNFFNKEDVEVTKYFTNYIQAYIDDAPYKDTINGIGLSTGRVKQIKVFKKMWLRFECESGSVYTIKQINNKAVDKFTQWLRSQAYAQSYISKHLSNMKAILRDADKRNDEVELNINTQHITTPKTKKKASDEIVYLTIDELKMIQSVQLKQSYLQNARKWLILGCYCGQRGGDLLSLTPKNIQVINGKKCFILRQQKTLKDTVVPMLPEVEELLKDGFPRPLSITKFREYIKEVCRVSKINEVMTGRQKVSSRGATTIEMLPKWKLISTHTCRRSFATNFYGRIPTPILMRITNHSTEKQFLEYIGKPQYEQALEIFNYL